MHILLMQISDFPTCISLPFNPFRVEFVLVCFYSVDFILLVAARLSGLVSEN